MPVAGPKRLKHPSKKTLSMRRKWEKPVVAVLAVGVAVATTAYITGVVASAAYSAPPPAVHTSRPRTALLSHQGGATGVAPRPGYRSGWVAYGGGLVLPYGGAPNFGSATFAPIAAIAATPRGNGYWVVGPQGRVEGLGSASPYFGPAPSGHVVSITSGPRAEVIGSLTFMAASRLMGTRPCTASLRRKEPLRPSRPPSMNVATGC